MSLVIEQTQPVPLAADTDGVVRVAGSRVSLDSVVHQFKAGSTPEQIQEDFPSLALREVYAVVTYYLQHTAAVEEYLRSQAQAAQETRRDLERGSPSAELRTRLQQRRARIAR
jgi:uncharacterized protein (DUF433 family)